MREQDGFFEIGEAFALAARADRTLGRVEIRVTALTTTLGIFAVNVIKSRG